MITHRYFRRTTLDVVSMGAAHTIGRRTPALPRVMKRAKCRRCAGRAGSATWYEVDASHIPTRTVGIRRHVDGIPGAIWSMACAGVPQRMSAQAVKTVRF
jgi:hypothetical protein